MLRNLAQTVKAMLLLAAQEVTADITTAAADLANFRNFAFQVAVGNFAFTNANKIALKIMESDDNITFTEAPAEAYYGSVKELVAAADANTVHLVQYRGVKRYVKLNLDVTGTVAAPVAVTGLSTELKAQPL